jgi:hypothetical protein
MELDEQELCEECERPVHDKRPLSLRMIVFWKDGKGFDANNEIVGFCVPYDDFQPPNTLFLVPLSEYPQTVLEYHDRVNGGREWMQIHHAQSCDARAQQVYTAAVKKIKKLGWLEEPAFSQLG